MQAYQSRCVKRHPRLRARILQLSTAHGAIQTPAFMPVGTRAYVNCLSPEQLIRTGTQILLGGNTYHMLCAPGLSVIEKAGGMHPFMGWQGPMLTDSGGFQVFSLSKEAKLCRIDEDGARVRHPTNGQTIHLTPETSIAAQKIIGADIMMAFDQCTPHTDDRSVVVAAMERTHRWLARSITAHRAQPMTPYGYPQALFGIVQGGMFDDLRVRSAEVILAAELDGVAIGGETIGFDMPRTVDIVEALYPLLPEHQAHYTMGVGLRPQDLIDVVAAGADIFDCVAPTRNARHGALYCGATVPVDDWVRFEHHAEDGRILIKKSCYAKDETPISPTCMCMTCQKYTRAYLHFLFKEHALLYYALASEHNIYTMHQACSAMRVCIENMHNCGEVHFK